LKRSEPEWPSGLARIWSWQWKSGKPNFKNQKTVEPKTSQSNFLFGSWIFGSWFFPSEMEFGIMGKGQPKSAGGMVTGFNLAAILLRPQYRGFFSTTAVVIASVIGLVIAWHRWGAPTLENDEYLVTEDKIVVTPQPAWIHTNVKADCLRSLAGTHLKLLDRDLVEKIAGAFAMHPWVAEVIRVEKRHPAQVKVDLDYRRPVLVVKLDAAGDEGLLFLDEQAVLLPSTDFAPSQARNYLRLAASGETPSGQYGMPWKSERLAGAAAIAAAVENQWQTLELYWIVTARIGSGDLVYELRSQDEKFRLIWGRPPGQESSGEPTAQQKVAALKQFTRDASSSEPKTIDLRQP
jgi:hypothetical protein